MNHKVRDIEQLYVDSSNLYNNVVCGSDSSADSMINNLTNAIDILKSNWKGADAGIKIQKIILVHNELIEVRNALSILARDSSQVAANYRRIQIANGASLGELNVINIENKNYLPDHIDKTDTIDINPEADRGRTLIESVRDTIDTFINNAKLEKDNILGNWLVGTGRNNADEAFYKFETNAKKNKETLNDVALDLKNALQNYQF